jgi:hypothetical protein
MKNTFITLVILTHVVSISLAKEVFKDNPFSMFSAESSQLKESLIQWRPVSNVQEECEQESKKRGHGGFGYPIQACSFWDKDIRGNRCLVITAPNLNMHTLGHEVRHCFQGSYHP